jgi:hypothetical protein
MEHNKEELSLIYDALADFYLDRMQFSKNDRLKNLVLDLKTKYREAAQKAKK